MPLVELASPHPLPSDGLYVSVGSRYVLFTPDQPQRCVSDAEATARPNVLRIVGDCDDIERDVRVVTNKSSDGCGGCGGGLKGPHDTLARVVNFSDKPRPLVGQGSGRSYGMRHNGELVLIQSIDAREDERFELA